MNHDRINSINKLRLHSLFVPPMLLTLVVLFGIFVSCKEKKGYSSQSHPIPTDTVTLRHAKGFVLEEADSYRIITILNPWKQDEIHSKYYLVENKETQTPADGKRIVVPLTSVVANSATYLAFLELLGVIDNLSGVCNPEYIYSPIVQQGIEEGQIKNIGDAFNLDIENLLMLRPQAIITPAYNAEDENTKKLEQSGLSVIYNIEWQEKTPLGRAEWIKFIAAFFNQSQRADSIFSEIENRYNELKKQVEVLSYAPTVMSGQDFRGTWSMPGGSSFNATLFRDAGANYLYANDHTSGSIPTNIENVLINFRDADVWVGAQVKYLKELEEADSKYKLFKAFKTGNVYNYNKRTNSVQGNDYWESAVARPDMLLADMVKVFHPDLLPDYELFYMEKLQ